MKQMPTCQVEAARMALTGISGVTVVAESRDGVMYLTALRDCRTLFIWRVQMANDERP